MSQFGDACLLLATTGTYTHWKLSKIMACIGYPITLNQCLIYYNGKMPIGLITFAYVSDWALDELMSGKRTIEKQDWQSGDNLFVPDLIAPHGNVRQMTKHFHKFVKGRHGEGFRCNWYRPALKRTGYARTRSD